MVIVLIQRRMEQAWNAKHVIAPEYSDSAEQPLLFSDDFMLIFVHCSLKANCFLVSCFGDHVRRGLTNTAILQLYLGILSCYYCSIACCCSGSRVECAHNFIKLQTETSTTLHIKDTSTPYDSIGKFHTKSKNHCTHQLQ